MSHLTAKDYQTALDIQSACNLSGVIFSFADIMQRLCQDVPNTADRNRHPICVLFAEQIKWLTLSELGYTPAYDLCVQAASASVSTPESLHPVCDNCGVACPPEAHYGTAYGHYCAACYPGQKALADQA